MGSLAVRLVLGVCFTVGVAASCSGSDGKNAVTDDRTGGAGGEQEAGGRGPRAGSNSGGKPQGGSAGSATDAGAAGSPNEGGMTGEGAASGQGGAAGEGAAPGQAGASGEAGASGNCCDPQVSYSASESVLPSDEACSPWTFTDTAQPEEATFNGGALRVETSADAENMYFIHTDANLSFPDVFVFEARMKFVSGTGSTPSRAPASMAFVYGPQHMKNMLQMSATEVSILASENVKGDSFTFDTVSDFHTYRIVVDTQENTLEVFVDDQLELSGDTFAAPNSGNLVLFGESSIYANGVSEWQFAKHNAYRCEL
jgi:hypothetical protein